jgi:hypothetical protein
MTTTGLDYQDESEDFPFAAGATVCVRVREDGGTSGRQVAKFEADVVGFDPGLPATPDEVVLDPPWSRAGAMDYIRLQSYDAEYEVVE